MSQCSFCHTSLFHPSCEASLLLTLLFALINPVSETPLLLDLSFPWVKKSLLRASPLERFFVDFENDVGRNQRMRVEGEWLMGNLIMEGSSCHPLNPMIGRHH